MKKINLILILIIFLLLGACKKSSFSGTRVATPSLYQLDITKMTGTETHEMSLKAGDRLNINFKTICGRLNMKIKASDGTIIYTGNGMSMNSFTVNISDDGLYSILVEAKNAKGFIKVILVEKE